MKGRLKFNVYFIILIMGYCCAELDVIVKIESGLVKGFTLTSLNGRQFYGFRGIPYAEPPIGPLRFKAPVVKLSWTGILDATQSPPTCLQYEFITRRVIGQEDCLIVNVFTPNFTSSEDNMREVLVFIHGGIFTRGTSSILGPRRLLDRNIVLVTLNYRISALGFLSTMDKESPGNYGLLDQLEALKWVQRNIHVFGGNPNKVTLGGQSSGGASTIYHMFSPLSNGLFQRALSLSGGILGPWAFSKNPLIWTIEYAEKLGCDYPNSIELMQCLRNVPAYYLAYALKGYKAML